MVPIDEYATVSEDATLYETVVRMEEARNKVRLKRDGHLAILVLDADDQIVGKVSLWDVFMGLEPRYKDLYSSGEVSSHELNPEIFRSVLETYGLWRQPFEDLCQKAAEVSVKEIMQPISANERVEAEASVEEAINHMVMGSYQSLIVANGRKVLGVLYLSDIFGEICRRIKECRC